MPDRTAGLSAAAQHARAFLGTLDQRPVAARADASRLRAALGGPVPADGEDPAAVIDALAAGAEDGLVASAGPRYFGFVTGGALPAALAADWLVAAWDQCAAVHSLSPAAAAIEEITSAWVLELLDLPATATVGFVTGGQAANTTCLAAARHAVLARAGWDVESDGLIGAPAIRIVCGERAHDTIDTALRLLGLGADTPIRIAGDDQGRMKPEALREALGQAQGPTIVCAPGRKRGLRRLRRLRTHRRRLRHPPRLVAHRRGVRFVGRRCTGHPTPDPRRRAGRLLGR